MFRVLRVTSVNSELCMSTTHLMSCQPFSHFAFDTCTDPPAVNNSAGACYLPLVFYLWKPDSRYEHHTQDIWKL